VSLDTIELFGAPETIRTSDPAFGG